MFIEFVQLGSSGRTKIWDVVSKSQRSTLGKIKWWGHWCQYTFMPEPGTIYSEECLKDIAAFCKSQTERQRGQKVNVEETA